MLTRIYIDNYRAFVNFEHTFESTQLLMGGNGSGKSSFLDALLTVRSLVVTGATTDSLNLLS